MFQPPWTKVFLDQCLLGQKSSWTNAPWTKWSLDNCPLDKCINTDFITHVVHSYQLKLSCFLFFLPLSIHYNLELIIFVHFIFESMKKWKIFCQYTFVSLS